MPKALSSPRDKATVLGSLTVVPLLVWWAGWFPAIMSSDSIDQWNQAITFEFQNSHPITHTAYLWVVSLIWENPAAVALVQVLLMAGLLALVARRLTEIGVQLWMSVAIVWVIALLPMTAATTITIWKDIPFTIAMGWVLTELLLLARDRSRFWDAWHGPVRLGIGLGLMWALRANGKLTAVVFLAVLLIGFRGQWRSLVPMAGATFAIGIGLPTMLIAVLPVTDNPIVPAQVFMPDVGSVVVHDAETFSARDWELVTAVASVDVWDEFYDCGDSGPLIFNPAYDNSVIRENPSSYNSLVIHAITGAPDTVAGHRWCAGEYLLSPYNRTDTYVHRPPFDIWPNDLGLTRDPLSDRMYDVTLDAYQLVEKSRIEWLTWRPAVYVLFGLVTYFALWRSRRTRPLAWIGILFLIHLGNVFATSPSHEFRYAFGLYLFSLVSLPLWYLIQDPSRAEIEV